MGVEQVIRDPKHPYTRELIHSIPVPDPGRAWIEEAVEEKQAADVGEAGEEEPAGCRYAPRCVHAGDKCGVMPPLHRLDDGRVASCVLYDDNPVLPDGDLTDVLAPSARALP